MTNIKIITRILDIMERIDLILIVDTKIVTLPTKAYNYDDFNLVCSVSFLIFA